MSLKGRLGSAVMKRMEAMPAIQAEKERSERISPAQRAAKQAAYGPLDDEAAKAALRERIGGEAEALREATIDLAKRRDDYIGDRAYRLLSAAAAETAVQSIPPERRELFSGEEAIGRMPIEQAFHRLAGIEPRLLDIERITRSAEVDAGGSLPPDVDRCIRSLVGGAAERDDELLRSHLASSIAQQYLRVLAGDSRRLARHTVLRESAKNGLRHDPDPAPEACAARPCLVPVLRRLGPDLHLAVSRGKVRDKPHSRPRRVGLTVLTKIRRFKRPHRLAGRHAQAPRPRWGSVGVVKLVLDGSADP
jgi:hypothetical protein